jgi:hypothetical protein
MARLKEGKTAGDPAREVHFAHYPVLSCSTCCWSRHSFALKRPPRAAHLGDRLLSLFGWPPLGHEAAPRQRARRESARSTPGGFRANTVRLARFIPNPHRKWRSSSANRSTITFLPPCHRGRLRQPLRQQGPRRAAHRAEVVKAHLCSTLLEPEAPKSKRAEILLASDGGKPARCWVTTPVTGKNRFVSRGHLIAVGVMF